uniref:Uncharacterized protein n=1 Tax=Melanopsichium pennsylvanicum 4 TaxID=1398559 RepID=A0A077RDW3_9BASI|nr:uncharacterized protein BN887_06247 [Melanopsichium pennsylvanicum 4]
MESSAPSGRVGVVEDDDDKRERMEDFVPKSGDDEAGCARVKTRADGEEELRVMVVAATVGTA